MTIKVISFDIDGTIVDFNYNKMLFEEAIPHLYSKRHKIHIKKAKKLVFDEYNKVSKKDINWYSPSFWFKRFGIGSHETLVKDLKHHIKLYADSVPVLKALSRRFKLVVISQSVNEFLEIKLEAEGIRSYFSKCYSTLNMFGDLKSPLVFNAVARELNIRKENMVHVGDDPEFDYLIPRRLGIKALLVRRGDRPEHHGGNIIPKGVPPSHVIKDLRGLVKKLDESGT